MRSHGNQCVGDSEAGMEGNDESPSSSIDSSSCPALSTTSLHQRASDLSTDLRLGLSLSTSSPLQECSSSKEKLSEKRNQKHSRSLFVKVYMDGIPIGRKLDLYAHNGYGDLISSLCRMFHTTIMFSGISQVPSEKVHVVTYEDKDGDWMMVGDTPWELFLTTVRRLKVTRADKC